MKKKKKEGGGRGGVREAPQLRAGGNNKNLAKEELNFILDSQKWPSTRNKIWGHFHDIIYNFIK